MRLLNWTSCIARLLAAAVLLIAGAIVDGRAEAAAGPWADDGHSRLRLVAAEKTIGATDQLELGLHFELSPGWKVYWRTPGDAGFPPHLDWSSSENLAKAEMLWPVPERFSLFGLETFGYGKEVVFPIRASLAEAGHATRLSATVDYLVCEEICVPHSSQVSLDLPAGSGGTSAESALISSYRAKVPGEGAEQGLQLIRAHLLGELETPRLLVEARSDTPFESPDIIVEGPPEYYFGKPEIELGDGGHVASYSIPVSRKAGATGVIEGKQLTLTLFDGARGLEAPAIARFAEMAASASLWTILAFALLGGLILNLMPCVLPVLSLKLLSAVGHGGRERGQVRLSFLASAAGILFSFLVLAGIAIGVKSLGHAVGWGIQFQQPLFLTAMAAIITLFACNLFGFFEIGLPGSIGELATRQGGHGLGKHFITGAFATLLATPCSAPFLGTAVGFALARGPAEILLVFAMLAVGLALPYLAVAAVPQLATALPRPGRWMLWLRRILGLALAGTAAWLLSVLANQIGGASVLVIAALLLVAAGLLFWLGRGGFEGRRRWLPTAALLIAAVAMPLFFGEDRANSGSSESGWARFDRTAIDELVGNGRLVFVDVTADWCITCQVNKKLVLDDNEIVARFETLGVVRQRADWTSPDPAISAYLESFGRYGIPFNAVYGPGAPQGIALPEILTPDAVTKALEQARG